MRLSAGVVASSLFMLAPSPVFAQDPACEILVFEYGACIAEKVPEKEQPRFMDQLTQWRLEWRALAAKPNTKLMLRSVCNKRREEAKAALGRYGWF